MQKFVTTFGLAALAQLWPVAARAHLGAKLDPLTFRERCAAYRHLDRQSLAAAPLVGAVAFFPTGAVDAGQTRFSFKQMRKAMRKAIKDEKGAHYDRHLRTWVFAHDEGHAAFPSARAAGAVHYRGRLFLFDGHHKALISTYLRAPRMPIKVVANWSYLTYPDFLRRMTEGPHHYAHWREFDGSVREPCDLAHLVNDPNLLLARRLLVKVDVRLGERGQLVIKNPRGAARPIVIKINNDIPFFEFELADALRRRGVIYDEGRREDDLSLRELRRYLAILRAERARPGSRLARILLLDEPKAWGKLDLVSLIKDHVKRPDCRDLLNVPARSED